MGLSVLAGWEPRLEEPPRLRLVVCDPDVRMIRLAIRPGTGDDVLEPLVTVVLPSGGAAAVRGARGFVLVPVHFPTAHEPAALAHEPARLARANEQIGERAPARGLDVHHVLDARTRLARQEAEDRLSGCRHGCRCGLSPARTRSPVGRLWRCGAVLGSCSRCCRRCRRPHHRRRRRRRRRIRSRLGDMRRRRCRRAHRPRRVRYIHGRGRVHRLSVITIFGRCRRTAHSRRGVRRWWVHKQRNGRRRRGLRCGGDRLKRPSDRG